VPNHTYRRHVPPALFDRVDDAFNAMWEVWEAACIADDGRLPRELVDELMQGMSSLQAIADELCWRGVRPATPEW
jgi:hypothetical protein